METTLHNQKPQTKSKTVESPSDCRSGSVLFAPVSVLCAARNSIYHDMDGVEVFDIDRDARTFQGNTPIIGHPPCRAWSAFYAHQAKPAPGEKELGLWVCEKLKECGGVIEQPAYTRLFAAAGLPLPGEPTRDGVWSLAVWQWWWGFPTKKATWLAFAGVPRDAVVLPFRLHNGQRDRSVWNRQSKNQRSATCREFAEFLISAARASVR